MVEYEKTISLMRKEEMIGHKIKSVSCHAVERKSIN
jgi:hypothetical protein